MRTIIILLISIFICAYNRADYKHWIDADDDCQDTRTEILIKRNIQNLTYNKANCRVISGKWLNEYSGEYIYYSRDIDLDHVISLSEADRAGAAKWNARQKMIFANDEENLVITDAHNNRSKGDKSPDEWLPKSKALACNYLKKREYIIEKYQLKLRIYKCL